MKKLLHFSGVLIVIALLAACGGGGGGSASVADAPAGNTAGDAPQTATLGIVLTDKKDSRYDEAIATITSIVLIGDSGQQEVYSGSMVVDLFKLRDFVELVTVADDISPGTITKIRLQLSSLVLIKRTDDGRIEERVDTHLAGNGKLDLKPNEPIEILPGQVVFLTFDFDMDKSLKITETGNGKVIVRPVVFVHVGTTPGFKDGITRVSGEIAALADFDNGFLLCMVDLMATPLPSGDVTIPERCIKVKLDDATGLFGEDGLPIEASELEIGDPVTVVGQLGLPDDRPIPTPLASSRDDSDSDSKSDSDSNSNSDSDSDSDSDGGDTGPRPPLQFVLNAIVVERGAPGTFASIRGTLLASPLPGVDDGSLYTLLVAPEQGFAPDTTLLGQLYPKSRIFNFAGDELDRFDTDIGDDVLVDGVILLTDAEGESDSLRTALMLVRSDGTSGPSDDILVGKVLGRAEGAGELLVATETGDRCVLGEDVLFVVDVEGSIEIIQGTIDDLLVDSKVVIFGVEDPGGCFDSDAIITRDPPGASTD